MVRWNKPGPGLFKLNTDGSVRDETGYWGAAIRDDKGILVRAAHARSKGAAIDVVELDALHKGDVTSKAIWNPAGGGKCRLNNNFTLPEII